MAEKSLTDKSVKLPLPQSQMEGVFFCVEIK
jgi:hypothetical protein